MEGSRNWFWKRVALEGFRSESDRFRPCMGSRSCWAFWTKLEMLNMVAACRKASRRPQLFGTRSRWVGTGARLVVVVVVRLGMWWSSREARQGLQMMTPDQATA